MCAVAVLAMKLFHPGYYSSNCMLRSMLRGWSQNWRCLLNQSGQSRQLRNLVAYGEVYLDVYLDVLDRKRMVSKRKFGDVL
jgi:hypothetical protein